jgi:purine-binding chemotaxis protein CheW
VNTKRTVWDELHRRLARSREAIEGLVEPGRERQERILRERALTLAKAVSSGQTLPAGEEIDVLAFQAAGERYAFEAAHVSQVLPMSSITPIPGVPKFVVGIVAAQGEVLAVIDLRVLLDLPLAKLAEPKSIVVLKGATMEFGILAEEILGTGRYPAAALTQGPPELTNNDALYLKGITPDRTAILNAEQLLSESSPVIVAG